MTQNAFREFRRDSQPHFYFYQTLNTKQKRNVNKIRFESSVVIINYPTRIPNVPDRYLAMVNRFVAVANIGAAAMAAFILHG